MKGNFCQIAGFRPSAQTLSAIDAMNDVIELMGILEKVVVAIPLFQIFAGRSSYNGVSLSAAGWNATTYDWTQFQSALQAIPSIKRDRLENIAYNAYQFSSGEDKKFWRCVYNAL